MKKDIGTLLILTAVLLSGCVKEELINPDDRSSSNDAIDFKVSDNWDKDEILTRTIIDDVQNGGISIFAANGTNSQFSEILSNEPLTYTSNKWDYEHTKYWVNGKTYRFLALYPQSDNIYSYNATDNKVTFDINESLTTYYMWDSHERTYNGDNHGEVVLEMEHVMSQVKIDIKNNEENPITVSAASLSGEYNSATCIIGGNVPLFNNPSTGGTYDNPANVNTSIGVGETKNVLSKYVIPQEIHDDTNLYITYTINSDEKDQTIDLNDYINYCDEWESGKTHVYVISVGNTIDVSINNGTLKIKNTGKVDEFIRVALIANWYEGNNIVKDGTVSYSIANGWSNPDSYYYYANAISKDSEVSLFSTTPSAPSGGPTGATWKLVIIVQGIFDADAASATAAFGS